MTCRRISVWSALLPTTLPREVAWAIMCRVLTTRIIQMMTFPSSKALTPTNDRKWPRKKGLLDGKQTLLSCVDSFTSTVEISPSLPLISNYVHDIIFSRERNRVHARNTRERKKSQMDGLQSRIQELVDEVSWKIPFRTIPQKHISKQDVQFTNHYMIQIVIPSISNLTLTDHYRSQLLTDTWLIERESYLISKDGLLSWSIPCK